MIIDRHTEDNKYIGTLNGKLKTTEYFTEKLNTEINGEVLGRLGALISKASDS